METDQQRTDSAPDEELVIAVDLGGTNLRAATIDSQGQIHERTKIDRKSVV